MVAESRGKRSRGNGEGSIYRRKSDGTWCASLTLENGKRKVLYGRTRQEVVAKLRKAQNDREQGLPIGSDRLTLGASWIAGCVTRSGRRSAPGRTPAMSSSSSSTSSRRSGGSGSPS
jgi:hypothetical protein